MFRKILLKYFPQLDVKSSLSPIKFHLKVLSPKLFYGLSNKYATENRRTIQIDTRFSYFFPFFNNFKDSKKENEFYSYKIFASLNAYNNYNIYTILSSITLLTFRKYYRYISEDESILDYMKPILFGVNYLLLMFFSRIKQYEGENKKENLIFMLNLLEKIIYHLEYTKDKKPDLKKVEYTVKNIMDILKADQEFMMFLYDTTYSLSKIYEKKSFTDILLYEYFVSWNVLDFPDEQEIKRLLRENCKKMFLKKNTYYIDVDMITLLNIIVGDTTYISYIVNPNSEIYLDYFVDSLAYLDEIDLNKNLTEVVDDVLDFEKWWVWFIESLKEFNTDNIDLDIDPSLWMQQIQDLMTKEMMDNVKQISIVNEQFLDYYLLLISRILNNNSDTFQFELRYSQYFYKELIYEEDRKLLNMYKELDKHYFAQCYIYKNKVDKKNYIDYYEYSSLVFSDLFYKQNIKILLSDFQRKTHLEYIPTASYTKLIKKYFYKDISKLLKNVEKNYVNKFYSKLIPDFKPTNEQIKNFRQNVYFPDFIVYYLFLKLFNKKIWYDILRNFVRIKETLFGYLVFRHIVWNSDFDEIYKSWLAIYGSLDIDITSFHLYITNNYPGFLETFANVKQNKSFVELVQYSVLSDNKNGHILFYDAMKDITNYNKRFFNI